MVRRSAFCASSVIASASSKISSLYGGLGYPGAGAPTATPAKSLILVRTTLMPRSSDAFSSSTRLLISSGPYSCRAMASAVLVLPVPGGP